ncbi:PP2C family serine/threonine-protein phosphatase [Bradyrhizobium sp.]|uniref:PP2C family protein-serine/threonine phosphatase n=1 Tax=Bradyrhizobium sp. TaxID=376 RepID=UPI00262F14C9|nr:PP2C family serine/threonine-protein phosphatase [Bradyrhizobium sp.]
MIQLKNPHDDRLQKRLADFLTDVPIPRAVNGTEALCLGTNIGSVRKQNEDRALIIRASYSTAPERNFVLGVVSDGIGGLSRGEEASTLAVSEFCSRVVRQSRLSPEARLRFAAEMANVAVFSLLKGKGGATLSAVLIAKGNVIGVNVGDSRIYGISPRRQSVQLTKDDTLASYLGRRDGKDMGSDVKGLVQFVGMGNDFDPHIITTNERDSESILITSDGVHDAPSEAIAQITQISRSNLDLVQRLLSLSGILGGRDNATALVIPTEFNPGTASDEGVTIACTSSFDSLEIWIPKLGNTFAESDDALEKQPEKEKNPAANVNSKGRKNATHYRQRKLALRKKKESNEAKLPLDEDPPSLSISFPDKRKS